MTEKIKLHDPIDENKILNTFYQKKQRVYAENVHPNYSICTSIYEEVNDILAKFNYSTIHVNDKAVLNSK